VRIAAVLLALAPAEALAYVGPGAGIAVMTTTLALLVSTVLALLALVSWPLRLLLRLALRRRPPRRPRIRRAILVGLDGLEPDLVARWMAEGKLPHFEQLARRGMFRRLHTTFPAMSPVAWSTFATGVHPAKHGIFDFLTRDPRSYLPALSSAEVAPPRRGLSLGPYRIPLGRPVVRLLRRSRPFWAHLGRYGIPSSVLRVPITFPPEPLHGNLLAAMCVPDLQGSQGTFSYFTTAAAEADRPVAGQRLPLVRDGAWLRGRLPGPENPIRRDRRRLELPFALRPEADGQGALLRIGRERIPLRLATDSDWVPLSFALGLGARMRGICRFRLLACGDEVRLYVTPINIDPAHPVLPISYPRFFATFLAKLIGPYATLGLAEDTWALNEGVLDEQGFLDQAWANHAEREAMFFEMLARSRRGLVTCVFDGTDRIQHMFMRYLDTDHPALRGQDGAGRWQEVIPETYQRMDRMIGRLLQQVDIDDPETLVAVLSDHGFKSFRRGVNLNSWLHRHGYLALRDGATGSGEWFRDVDWSRTRAYALGLGGIFLNVRGREASGVVAPGAEADALAQELAARLGGLIDDATGEVAIREVYPAHTLYRGRGPYADQAPDLIVGYAPGWRASWDGVRGIVDEVVFADNCKAWSGDHCIDPGQVPGVILCNQKLLEEAAEEPSIADLAPTLLTLFGIPAPSYMDGRSWVAP
jgi:predicted AlkP superfamily phosphohydrolase/phosphomutase